MSTRPRLPAFLRRRLAAQLAKPVKPRRIVRQRRVCIYKVDRIGDFVLALGALRALVQHYGASECRLIVSSLVAPFAAAEFPEVERWEVPPDASSAWHEIRPLRRAHAATWSEEKFAELVCLRHARSIYRDITLGWIEARAWHGLGSRPTPGTLFVGHKPALVEEYPSTATHPWCRELLAHRAVVAAATGATPDWATLRPRLASIQGGRGSDWVFCPFGSEPNRDYPEDLWIIAWRDAALPAGPVQLLGPEERRHDLASLAERLRGEAGRPEVDVAVNLPQREFIARLAAARGIVTVESAAAHFATAFDKPAVIVIGGGHFGWFAPWGDRARQQWLSHSLPCFGCDWQCPYPTIHCVVDQPAGSVAAALRKMAVTP